MADLAVSVGVTGGEFRTGLARLRQESQTWSQEVGRTVRGAFSGIGRTLGVGLSGAAFVGMARQAMNTADEIDKTAERIGITREEVQRLRFAESQLTDSSGQVDRAMARLGRRAVANEENFRSLGIEVRDASGGFRGIREILDDVADAIANAETNAEALNIAQETMGQSGRDLVPMFREGAEGLRRMGREADNMGQIISEDTVQRLADANDQIDQLTTRLRILFAEGAGRFMDFGEGIGEGVAKMTGSTEREDPFIRDRADLRRSLREAVGQTEDPRELDDIIRRIETSRRVALADAQRSFSAGDFSAGEDFAEEERRLRSIQSAIEERRSILEEEMRIRGLINQAAREQEEREESLRQKMEEQARLARVAAQVRDIIQAGEEDVRFSRLTPEEQQSELQDRADDARARAEDEALGEDERLNAAEQLVNLEREIERIRQRQAQLADRERDQELREAQRELTQMERERDRLESQVEQAQDEARSLRLRDIREQGDVVVDQMTRVGGGGMVNEFSSGMDRQIRENERNTARLETRLREVEQAIRESEMRMAE